MLITPQLIEHATSNILHCSVIQFIHGHISGQPQSLFFFHILLLHNVTLQVKLFHSRVFLMGYNAVYSVESDSYLWTRRTNQAIPQQKYLFRADIFLGLFFNPEAGGDLFLRNVG
jgi:hypothetical protein